MALENQRYGRNKSTLVNKTYVDSGEYKRKYDSATDNKEVNKSLYDCAKKALKHRSGTAFEDMYWIDGETGRVMLSVTDSADERTITYTDRINGFTQCHACVVQTTTRYAGVHKKLYKKITNRITIRMFKSIVKKKGDFNGK